MNYALSQRRPGRHPVGILIVIGLHVVLGAVMLTAKMRSAPPPPADVVMIPIDQPIRKVEPTRQIEPKKTEPVQRPIVVPDVRIDEPSPVKAEVQKDDKPIVIAEPTLVASVQGEDRHEAPRLAARRTTLDAGAAQCRPVYPAAAQRAGAQGTSRIRFTVDAVGHVVGAQILQSSGSTREHRMMDKAAAEALAQCPVTLGIDESGRAVGGTADVDYVWTLN